jgi:hypothetical protein
MSPNEMRTTRIERQLSDKRFAGIPSSTFSANNI